MSGNLPADVDNMNLSDGSFAAKWRRLIKTFYQNKKKGVRYRSQPFDSAYATTNLKHNVNSQTSILQKEKAAY